MVTLNESAFEDLNGPTAEAVKLLYDAAMDFARKVTLAQALGLDNESAKRIVPYVVLLEAAIEFARTHVAVGRRPECDCSTCVAHRNGETSPL